ncbi:helix-turn-helix domain-containing protein [Streptomyces sp. NPDC059851]|uniref:helix-turn-helix domain-containing protein n=1 Tax=Streptomyces sp. NPDC059851 TaxID=3346971 RepID=UPI0036547E26
MPGPDPAQACVDRQTSSRDGAAGQSLRRARVLKGWSQERLGAGVGYWASWVSRVERGKIPPDRIALARLCGVLDVATHDLAEGADVHRREMLTLGLGLGLGAAWALPTTGAAAAEPYTAAVERAHAAPPCRPQPRDRHDSRRPGDFPRARLHLKDYPASGRCPRYGRPDSDYDAKW